MIVSSGQACTNAYGSRKQSCPRVLGLALSDKSERLRQVATCTKPCLLNSHPRDGTPILGALSGNDGGTVSDGRTGLG